MRIGGRSIDLLVAAALLAMIPIAWWQWRWISELSEVQRERQRAEMRAALDRITDEVDRDALRRQAMLSPRARGFMPVEDWLRSLSQEFESLPLRRIYWLQEREQRWKAWVWDTARERFVETDVPAWWQRRPMRGAPFLDDPPALLGSATPPGEGGPPDPLVLELDVEELKKNYFPRVVFQQLGVGLQSLEVRIFVTKRPEEILYSSGSWSGPAEASVGLLRGARLRRLGPGGPGFGGGPPIGGPGPGERPGMLPPFLNEPGPGVWTLEIRHKEGTVEAMVARTRNRNLAASGITMLILAGALLALAHGARRARRLAQLQMEFTAGVSHELRTPLAVIVSAGDNLAGGYVKDPEKVKSYGATVRDEGERLTGMVDHILRFSALESLSQGLDMKPIRASAVVDSVEKDMRREAAGLGCTWVSSGDDAPLRGDPGALHAALRNLVENALRHGCSGGWVGLRTEADAKEVRFVVEDRGPGIPAADLKHVFEPFYRGADSRAAQRKGSGLGLALVERIARAHGGSVSAENRKEGGARFTLRLPAV